MPAFNLPKRIFADIASRLAAIFPEDDFTCSDCDRWSRCGLEATEKCVYRAEQIESGKWKAKKASTKAIADIMAGSGLRLAG